MARSVGYTTSLDENRTGIVSVGGAVRDASGTIIAAISVAYPRPVGPQVEIAEIGAAVVAAAARISAGLGFAGTAGPTGEGPRHAA